jgi:thymidylate synthase (FAD)
MKTVKANYEILLPVEPAVILKHLERCGRVCYKSEELITDESAEVFVKNIRTRKHFSVLEHFGITVIFTVDRGVTHELVRHRIASYSQESTRFCNYGKGKFGNQVTYIDIENGIDTCPVTGKLPLAARVAILSEWQDACIDAEKHYFNMLELGASPQIARSVLNHSTKADIATTFNLREWGYVFGMRDEGVAGTPHPQMIEVMRPLHIEFIKLFPSIYAQL